MIPSCRSGGFPPFVPQHAARRGTLTIQPRVPSLTDIWYWKKKKQEYFFKWCNIFMNFIDNASTFSLNGIFVPFCLEIICLTQLWRVKERVQWPRDLDDWCYWNWCQGIWFRKEILIHFFFLIPLLLNHMLSFCCHIVQSFFVVIKASYSVL